MSAFELLAVIEKLGDDLDRLSADDRIELLYRFVGRFAGEHSHEAEILLRGLHEAYAGGVYPSLDDLYKDANYLVYPIFPIVENESEV